MTTHAVPQGHLTAPGWNIARGILAVVSVVALLSWGGQGFYVLPVIGLQWYAITVSTRPWRIAFTVLAVLLVAEVGWMAGYVVTEDGAAAIMIAVPVAVVAGILFARTSDDAIRRRTTPGDV